MDLNSSADSSSLAMLQGSLGSATRPRAIVHERENSRDELEALFNPNKWSQSKVPFSRRNLPSSFFIPPPTGTKTPNSRSNSNAASLNSSACHSRQNSIDELNLSQQSVRQHQQNLILNQKLKNLVHLNANHSRSNSEPVSMPPCALNRRLLQPALGNKASELGQQTNYQALNNGGHLSPQIFRQQAPQAVKPSETQLPQQFPPGWRAAHTTDGSQYYVNYITNETSWHLPQPASVQSYPPQSQQYNGQPSQVPAPAKEEPINLSDPKKVEQLLEQIPMPQGWEKMQTKDGRFYFINHNTKTTCWEDPRMPLLPNYVKTLRQAQQHDPFGGFGASQTSSMMYQPGQTAPQHYQGYDQLKSSLMEIVQKRMDLIKVLEDINKQEAYLKNQINSALGDNVANSPVETSWTNPSNTYPAHSMPSLTNTPTFNGQASLPVRTDGYETHSRQQSTDYSYNDGLVNPAQTHRREQSIELEHMSSMYNKMLINNSAGYGGLAPDPMATNNAFDSVNSVSSVDSLQDGKSLMGKSDSSCLLLGSDLVNDTDSISDDYSLSSSSTASLININL